MEITVIRDYKKVCEYETTKSPYCLSAPILATKLFDFKLLGLDGWSLFGISPALVFGSIGLIALVTIGSSVITSGGFSKDNLKSILITIITLILLVAFLTADFHIYI